MNQRLSLQELKALRLEHQGLLTPKKEPLQALTATIGIQSQHPKMAELNLALHSEEDSPQLFSALAKEHKIVRAWGQRWTLQLFTMADWQLVTRARSNESMPKNYYLNQKDLVFQTAESILPSLLMRKSWQKSDFQQLMNEMFPSFDLSTNLPYSLLQLLASRGNLFFAADSALASWEFIPVNPESLPPLTAEDAIEKLITRYIIGFGPVSLEDFVHWSGIKISHVKKAWLALAPNFSAYEFEGKDLLAPKSHSSKDLAHLTDKLADSLLVASRFDASMTGYKEKKHLIPAEFHKIMWTKNGLLMAPIFLHGELAAHWTYQIRGNKIFFEVFNWKSFAKTDKTKLADTLQFIADYLDKANQGIKYQFK